METGLYLIEILNSFSCPTSRSRHLNLASFIIFFLSILLFSHLQHIDKKTSTSIFENQVNEFIFFEVFLKGLQYRTYALK